MAVAAKNLAIARMITKDHAIALTNNPKLFDDVALGGAPPDRRVAPR